MNGIINHSLVIQPKFVLLNVKLQSINDVKVGKSVRRLFDGFFRLFMAYLMTILGFGTKTIPISRLFMAFILQKPK